MRHTYTCLLYHVVFSTKERVPSLDAALRPRLFAYMGGIAIDQRGRMMEAGGVEDHVHLLLESPATLPVSTMIKEVKGGSSRWINANELCAGQFAWQRGYAAFAVSRSAVEHVRAYLRRQPEHHRERSYHDELSVLLDRHGIEHEPFDTKSPPR